MYYQYWGLKKPAFDNVPDPSMYVDCHASMENAIAETLFAIEEGDECIAVIVGDVGLGKTLSIRIIIDMLAQEKYKIALITNPGVSFVQILQEIIGQLTGVQCHEKRKVNLLETFNRLLFSTFEEGRKILIFIDEANAITPANLENLRLLTNMQSDKGNLFTMVLAGQIEFAKRLEHPKRANLFQRVGTYNRIDKLESADKVRRYVETRLALAGATREIFAGDAFDRLWEQSDRGVPRLVNKLSKLCLKAGETNHFECISGDVVDQIGSRFHKLTGPAIPKRRSRRYVREEIPVAVTETADELRDIDADLAKAGEQDSLQGEEAIFLPWADRLEERTNAEDGLTDQAAGDVKSFTPQEDAPGKMAEGEKAMLLPQTDLLEERRNVDGGLTDQAEGDIRSFTPQEDAPGKMAEGEKAMLLPQTDLLEERRNVDGGLTDQAEGDIRSFTPQEDAPGKTMEEEMDSEEEMSIGHVRIKIHLPRHLIKQSLSSTQEHRFKLAGGLAADALRKNPDLLASQDADPVPIWEEIRNFVLNRINHASGIHPSA